jgi:hypothetical protein
MEDFKKTVHTLMVMVMMVMIVMIGYLAVVLDWHAF